MKKLLSSMAVIIAVMLCVIGLPMNALAAEPQTSEQTTEDTQAAASDDIAAFKLVFDAAYYYCAYPDVAAAFGTDYDLLLQHYIKDGAIHGRSASAEFNLQVYKSSYKDLEEAFGDNLAAYCRHYISFGKKEGRIANKPEAANVNMENAPAELLRTGQTIGTCTTYYNAKIPRATNVILAASRINGVTLQPGEQFSYNIAVLPRTTANGYVNAPVFVNGGHGMGIGGGICQVSSTLYAAMLNCGLPATERHPHSLPVTYLPAGYDATISGNAKDLKFVNIYSQPLQIRASADDGVLTVWLVLL